METWLFPSLKSSLKRLDGMRARLSTLTSSGTASSSEKWSQLTMAKLAELLAEREELREQVRLLQADLDRCYDI